MSEKRAEARARAEARKQAKARVVDETTRTAPSTELANERDVTPYLRKLGCRADEARRVAALCESIPNASLEERVRFALKHLMPPHRHFAAATAT